MNYIKLKSEGLNDIIDDCEFYDLEVRRVDDHIIAVKMDDGGEIGFTHEEIEALYVYSKQIQ